MKSLANMNSERAELQNYCPRTSSASRAAAPSCCSPTRAAHYDLFDMTRGLVAGGALSRKSGNYIGKLRVENAERTDYTFVSAGGEELAGVRFERASLVQQLLGDSAPRKMHVVLPPLDSVTLQPAPREQGSKGLLSMLYSRDFGRFYVFESKEPQLLNAIQAFALALCQFHL